MHMTNARPNPLQSRPQPAHNQLAPLPSSPPPPPFSYSSIFPPLSSPPSTPSSAPSPQPLLPPFPVDLHPISLYSQLLSSGLLPIYLTFPFLFKHCSLRLLATSGQCLQNAMVFFYATCGFIRHSRRVFDEMPQKDLVSWNSLLIGYLKCGEADEAMDVFHRMGIGTLLVGIQLLRGLFSVAGRRRL